MLILIVYTIRKLANITMLKYYTFSTFLKSIDHTIGKHSWSTVNARLVVCVSVHPWALVCVYVNIII